MRQFGLGCGATQVRIPRTEIWKLAFKAQGEGSVMALPIVGEFLKRSYEDPRLGLSKNAKFSRPEGWESYDCPKEMDAAQGAEQHTTSDEFFN